MASSWHRWIVEHRAADDTEAGHLRAIRSLLDLGPQAADRATMTPGHLTASAFVLSPDLEALALIHHEALGRWLQPGGHLEPDDVDPLAAARREVEEETGLRDLDWLPGAPWLLDVDVHAIPPRPSRGEGAHRHHDLRFLFRARSTSLRAGEGVSAARWVPLDALDGVDTDDSVRRAVGRILALRAAWRDPAARRHAPATARNRGPIAQVLRRWCPPGASVLELPCGTGEHAVHLADALGVARWWPADLDDDALRSTLAHGLEAQARGEARAVSSPLRLDAASPVWWGVPEGAFDLVFSANLIHIAPWDAGCGLLEGAARALKGGGHLALYGPFHVAGAPTAPSNAAFDESLRARDATWGVRHLEAVVGRATEAGLRWRATVPMPANNLTVVFERPGATPA